MNIAGKACVLLLDLPTSAFCGIDLLSFTTSPHFRGVKNIPPGWHFVFTGVTNSFSLRHGAWFFVQETHELSPQLFIKKWEAEKEELIAVNDVQEILEWRANLGPIWREGLTPYRQSVEAASSGEEDVVEETADWDCLTDCITEKLLSRISGLSTTHDHWNLTSASAAKQDVDYIPGLSYEENILHQEKELKFLPVNLKQTWREGAFGRERTEAARDRSWALGQLIHDHCDDPLDIIGELQVTFAMVLTLNNNSCLAQWRRIISLLLTCRSAVTEHSVFFVRFLATLKLQLQHCQDADTGLFDLSDEGGNLLKYLLKGFRRGLEEQSGKARSDVMDELDDLEEYLKLQHGWLMNDPHVRRGMIDLEDGERVEMDLNGVDEEDESGDYAPVVVELTPEQARNLYHNGEIQHGSSQVFENISSPKSATPVLNVDEEDEQELEDLDPRY